MRLAKFNLESLGYETFEGFTKDEYWNGWDCPYFTFEQASKVLNNYNELRRIVDSQNLARYDSEADAFVFPSDEENEPETFSFIIENDQKYYPVGAFCRIWEEEV